MRHCFGSAILSSFGLGPEGFILEAAHDGETGVARILDGGYALVILDLMLPGVGGFEVLRRVRQQSQVPVILLTARGATTDRILGFEIGADDYLPKPFDPRELVARVRSLLRRARFSSAPEGEFLQSDDVSVDGGKREARLRGEPLELTNAEFDLLRALLASAGRPVPRETLFQTVLEREFAAYDRSIDNLVSSLRRKLGPDVQDFDDMAARIEELVTAQRRLIADVSHELGSPLTRVNVALGLAFRKANAESRPELERIGRETERLSGLIHQLLLLSQLESRASIEPFERLNLRELIDEVAADASFEAENAGRGVRVTAPAHGLATVRGMRRLIASAVENVVRNAIRYTAPGTEVRIELLGGGNGTATVRVRDHGPGVPAEALEHLFEPFYRVQEARDRQTGGAGLGLAIAERAVHANGGSVRVMNAAGGGLCVEMELPTAG